LIGGARRVRHQWLLTLQVRTRKSPSAEQADAGSAVSVFAGLAPLREPEAKLFNAHQDYRRPSQCSSGHRRADTTGRDGLDRLPRIGRQPQRRHGARWPRRWPSRKELHRPLARYGAHLEGGECRPRPAPGPRASRPADPRSAVECFPKEKRAADGRLGMAMDDAQVEQSQRSQPW
jgi:hypothetical protein